MNYQEFLPAPPLRPYIRKYGFVEQPHHFDEPATQWTSPSLSKGLMIHYRKDSFLDVCNGKHAGQLPKGFMMAQSMRPVQWYYDRPWGFMATLFQPGQFRRFFPFSTAELTDYFIEIADPEDRSWFHLYEQLVLTHQTADRVHIADEFLLKMMSQISLEVDHIDHYLGRPQKVIDYPQSL